jgi:flavin-dependent dehydrogenase
VNAAPSPETVETPSVSADCDVLVIGGGPAGSTIAALLAERGWTVTLLEKDRHPRFHIGESLLPMNLPILERLGVLDEVNRIGVVKYGAELCSSIEKRKSRTIYFANAIDKTHPYAFQVRRSEFDHLLLGNCASKGANVYECVRVTDVDFPGSGRCTVHACDADGNPSTYGARFVVDASGRDTFLSKRLGLKKKNRKHNMAAMFGHFDNVLRRPGRDAGNIGIYWFEHGWFWMIPLRDGVMSVGAVCWPEYLKTRRGSLYEFLWDTIELCPDVHQRMAEATMRDGVHATGNYSYESTRMHGDDFLLIGDAFAFVDPLFSSGVFFAMHSASLGADVVEERLRNPGRSAASLKKFDRTVRRGIRTLSWFIYRFTSPAMRNLFLYPPRESGMTRSRWIRRIEESVISMLAGDVFRRTPIGLPLGFLKAMYYLNAVGDFVHAWRSYWLRARNAKLRFDVGDPRENAEF